MDHVMTLSAVAKPVLSVRNLRTVFPSSTGEVVPVNDVSFSVGRGEVLGLVGESGSGKSMTGFSIMGLLDKPGYVSDGSIEFTGRDGRTCDLRDLERQEMRGFRGNRIAMVFQDPMMTLNPVLRIETQMVEAIQAHAPVHRAVARQRSIEVLAKVGISSPESRIENYPHQFSGGMRQRVAIAIALLNAPDLIIADEPTTALDVTIQAQILYEMQKLCRESGTALIWITHDLSVIAGLADAIAVMYAGRIVEYGSVDEVLSNPRHPYTHGLIDCAPTRNVRGSRLNQIRGMAPALSQVPTGCAFAARCDNARPSCVRQQPPTLHLGASSVRCLFPLPSHPKEQRHATFQTV